LSQSSLFQEPARTPEEIEASKPLDIPPEKVLEVDEPEWYARVYRQNAPQLTVRAVLMGTVLGFFLSFTNVYIGLKTGWFLGVNLTACILSYAIWQGAKRRGLVSGDMSILENTCAVSTASSAGYATGNQLISAIPAMLILSVSPSSPGGKQLPWFIVGAWVFCLGALGVTLAIPMKRSMINRDKLKFPSGTAAAVTLQGLYSRGAEAIQKARVLFITAGISALVPLLKELEIVKGKEGREALLPGQSNVFDWIGNLFPNAHMFTAGPAKLHKDGAPFHLSDYQVKLDHGVALMFAGMIIGIRVAAWMVVGGLILVIFVAPPALDWQWMNAKGDYIGAATKPGSAWKEIGIWTGAPLLVASGLVSFAAQWRTIVRAIEGALPGKKNAEKTAYRGPFAGEGNIDPATVEVPGKWFAIGTITSGLAVVTLATLYFDIPAHLGVLAVLMTFVLALVACRATGESDITPGGAMGKIMQLTYGVLIPQSTTANLMTASITSGSSLASADLLNDLKTGYLLGANPRRQYIAQALGIFTGAVATTLCYYVLVPDASVLLGSETRPPAFPAPAAQQWKAVAEVFKHGFANLHPMSQKAIIVGLIIGTILACLEAFVPKQYKKWVPSPTGIGLGFTLPFFYPLAIFLGAVFAEVASYWNKAWAERYVVTIAAGGIAGESIVGVIVQALNNFVLH
jgi:OPT family oligopeptide transporter